jgi:hypothetical protein
MPGPSIRSMRVIEQFSIVKASAASGSRSSANANAARIVPPCATAMMSPPGWQFPSFTDAPQRQRPSTVTGSSYRGTSAKWLAFVAE